jgi:hypothetical protein
LQCNEANICEACFTSEGKPLTVSKKSFSKVLKFFVLTFFFLYIIYLYVFNIVFQVTHMPWKKMPLQLLNVAWNLWSMPANVELALIVSLGVVIK